MKSPILHVVSMSGGKDSTATALLCRELHDPETIRYVFADTGNEHPLTYEYLDYLQGRLNAPIDRLKVDFSARLERKATYIATHWRNEGVDEWIVQRAIKALVPTGIPFLDLCLWKGRFPSRKAQFCTQFLKTEPLVEYQMDLIDAGHIVWSWQGIRADESGRRRHAKSFEEVGGGLFINRPILTWPAEATFEAMACCGVEPNPLYRLGMSRVGCMPCINCGKDELAEIARRWPDVIARIEMWEGAVAQASKRGASSFFPAPEDGRADLQGRNIRERLRWAMTSFGGRQFDLLATLPAEACRSSYGLCE